MKSFRDLKVWEKAHQLSLAIYKVTKEFPMEEKFGLVSQKFLQLIAFKK